MSASGLSALRTAFASLYRAEAEESPRFRADLRPEQPTAHRADAVGDSADRSTADHAAGQQAVEPQEYHSGVGRRRSAEVPDGNELMQCFLTGRTFTYCN